MVADPAMRAVSAAFPAWCAVSLGLPFAAGWGDRRQLARHAPFDPACARHGADPRQIEISAAVIRIFERLGWATSVHWPARARLEPRCRDQGQHPASAGTPDSEALISPAPT
jgi:hypothetical protein